MRLCCSSTEDCANRFSKMVGVYFRAWFMAQNYRSGAIAAPDAQTWARCLHVVQHHLYRSAVLPRLRSQTHRLRRWPLRIGTHGFGASSFYLQLHIIPSSVARSPALKKLGAVLG